MFVLKESDRSWKPIGAGDIDFCVLRENDRRGGCALVRLHKGARFPRHNHLRHEDTLILSGSVTIGGARVSSGDYLHTGAGEIHDVVANEETLLFVATEEGIEIMENV